MYNQFLSTGKVGVNFSTSGAIPHAPFQFRNDARSISFGPMETFGNGDNTSDFWNTSYLGFNAHRDNSGNWISYSDAASGGAATSGNNGGVVLRAGLNGDFYIACIPKKSGASSTTRTYTDDSLGKYTIMRWRYAAVAGTDPAFVDVAGTIRAKEVRVSLSVGWPDYVFSPEYKLLPFAELRSYLKVNRHLPGLPPASEVDAVREINVSEQLRLQLEKMEELTLYILQLEERIRQLENPLR